MKVGSVGAALVLTGLVVVSPSYGQEACLMGSPETLVRNFNRVLGDGPLWVAVSGDALGNWEGRNEGMPVIWVRDYEISGAVLISGANRESGEAARFAESTVGLSNRNERHRLGNIGYQPDNVSQAALRRYSFHRGAVFFPEPGCYEITARVGRENAMIFVNVEQK